MSILPRHRQVLDLLGIPCRTASFGRPLVFGAVFLTIIVLAAALLSVAHAHQSGEPFAEWFTGLRQPDTGVICCGGPGSAEHDCYPTDYREANTASGYEALVGGAQWGMRDAAWVAVPPNKILQRMDNPTGRAVACWRSGEPFAAVFPGFFYCFVRPPET